MCVCVCCEKINIIKKSVNDKSVNAKKEVFLYLESDFDWDIQLNAWNINNLAHTVSQPNGEMRMFLLSLSIAANKSKDGRTNELIERPTNWSSCLRANGWCENGNEHV